MAHCYLLETQRTTRELQTIVTPTETMYRQHKNVASEGTTTVSDSFVLLSATYPYSGFTNSVHHACVNEFVDIWYESVKVCTYTVVEGAIQQQLIQQH